MSPDRPRYAVGTLVGLAGLLLFAEPLVGRVTFGPVAVRPVALSVGLLALGLSLGDGLFLDTPSSSWRASRWPTDRDDGGDAASSFFPMADEMLT